jgi:creatinine amidohydrolase
MSNDLGAMTRLEFTEALGRNPWLLLPVGTTEEHGPHLPLASDTIQAEHVCHVVACQVNGIVAPSIAYGVCRATRNFPGTISLSSGTLEALVREILAEYVEKGVRRIAVISGHAGGAHMQALRQAALPLAEQDEALTILVVGPYDIPLPSSAEARPNAADGHAASLETSVMLAIDPNLVRGDRISESETPRLPRFHVICHPERLFPSGVMGDASTASRALGEHALRHVANEIVRILQEATPLDPRMEGRC